MSLKAAGLALAIALAPAAVLAQDAATSQAAKETQSLEALLAKEAKIGPAKKAFVEEQLALSPEELAKFRPIYEEHQEMLRRYNRRRLDNVTAYSREWNAQTLSAEKAHALSLEALAIDREEGYELEMTYGKVRTAIPALKAAHYLQIESKMRALVRYQQAASVPVLGKKPPG